MQRRLPSTYEYKFSQVPNVAVPRSSFDRSHGLKTTFDGDYLIPIFIDEVLPGDSVSLSMTGFARLATPIFPIMDNMFMETFFFFVPNRLLWENWVRFCGEKDDPTDSIDFTVPIIASDAGGFSAGSIYDYFGIPIGVTASFDFNALPLRAYYLIYHEWFRDQNLQSSARPDIDDGPDLHSDYALKKRGKRHDYFTSCLPWLQKGDAVTLSLGTEAPLAHYTGLATEYIKARRTDTDALVATDNVYIDGTNDITAQGIPQEIYFDLGDRYYADLSTATAGTVNELRQSIQVQRLLEKDARAGTRYVEILKSHFGVDTPDYRVQRPEYLGGGSSRVSINPVARTEGAPGSGTGELGGVGFVGLDGHGFVKSFTEHGYVIGLVNVRADLTYQEGLHRMWSRETRYDFYWPVLAHLGEQAVLNKEIYLDAASIGDSSCEDVFGYQERFAEYRYLPSRLSGDMRSTSGASLDAWHLAEEFGSQPALNAAFIRSNTPIDRVVATPTDPHFIMDCYFKYKCARPMPLYSVPGLVDHF